MAQSFYQHTLKSLVELFQRQGLSKESAPLLFNWHYKMGERSPCAHHNLPVRTRAFVDENFHFELPSIELAHRAADRTVKFLLRLKDGQKVETVLIPFQNKYTLCLSSQVGCAMNCTFCFTATMGFSRHLTADEIVGQFLVAQDWLRAHRPGDDRILNLVYMGQGEPLHNFEAVRDSAFIFVSQYGLSLAGHKITVSTSGYLPGLSRWREEMPDVNIALSLHAADDQLRSRLIPINRRFPLAEILPKLDAIPIGKKRFVTYEYLLIEGVNDGVPQAHAVGELLKGKKALLNLIPFNEFPGSSFKRPSRQTVLDFKRTLDEYQLPTMIRTTKGDEILAACGQLKSLN